MIGCRNMTGTIFSFFSPFLDCNISRLNFCLMSPSIKFTVVVVDFLFRCLENCAERINPTDRLAMEAFLDSTSTRFPYFRWVILIFQGSCNRKLHHCVINKRFCFHNNENQCHDVSSFPLKIDIIICSSLQNFCYKRPPTFLPTFWYSNLFPLSFGNSHLCPPVCSQ